MRSPEEIDCHRGYLRPPARPPPPVLLPLFMHRRKFEPGRLPHHSQGRGDTSLGVGAAPSVPPSLRLIKQNRRHATEGVGPQRVSVRLATQLQSVACASAGMNGT